MIVEAQEWQPISVDEATRLMDGAPFRWWIAGGHALELHLGQQWRSHEDLDVGICRYQVDRAVTWFDGWDIHAAHEGALIPWGSPHRADTPNNLWLRRDRASPWSLDLTVGEGTETEWVYRRDSEVRRPWPDAVCRSESGIPYLAPELQLLFKSKQPRAKDHADAERVIPGLSREQRAFLELHLPPKHPWRSLLRGRK